MTEAKHTPGPWRYDPDWKAIWGGSCDVEIVAPHGCQFESDARLIAAAPDMLRALKSLDNLTASDAAKVVAAIAKAEGRDT